MTAELEAAMVRSMANLVDALPTCAARPVGGGETEQDTSCEPFGPPKLLMGWDDLTGETDSASQGAPGSAGQPACSGFVRPEPSGVVGQTRQESLPDGCETRIASERPADSVQAVPELFPPGTLGGEALESGPLAGSR